MLGDSQTQEYAYDKSGCSCADDSLHIASQLINHCKCYRKDQPFEQCGSILLHQVLHPSIAIPPPQECCLETAMLGTALPLYGTAKEPGSLWAQQRT